MDRNAMNKLDWFTRVGNGTITENIKVREENKNPGRFTTINISSFEEKMLRRADLSTNQVGRMLGLSSASISVRRKKLGMVYNKNLKTWS